MNKQYNLAVAFLQFKIAYQALVKASKDMPDHDVSEYYPFYLLDFEGIVEPVAAWCNVQATKLLRELPDKVDNPACLYCPDFKIGIGPDGLCKAAMEHKCKLHPFIMFTKDQVLPVLMLHKIDVKPDESETDVYLKYMKLLEVLDVKRSEQKEAESKMVQGKILVTGGPSILSNMSNAICRSLENGEGRSTISIDMQPGGLSEGVQRALAAAVSDSIKTTK